MRPGRQPKHPPACEGAYTDEMVTLCDCQNQRAMEAKCQVIFDADPSREVLLLAWREVQQMLEAPGERTKVSLVLPAHYPFFDQTVQSVLMERHPEQWRSGTPCYAVDAY